MHVLPFSGSPEDSTSNAFDKIISISPIMQQIKNEARLISRGTSNVLIMGESGTGKEILARAIHTESRRRGQFVKVNCAAIPETLLESELFGYCDGAFTGARRGGKAGKVEIAHEGTLFLDEIGEMSPGLQTKLLEVTQDHSITRLGDTHPRKVDIRIIAATNQDLEKLVEEGKFRLDLYYRLNVVSFKLPPLRERREDIIPIAMATIERFNALIGQSVSGISPEAINILEMYHWPGNVRELENVIERAMNFVTSGLITPECLSNYLIQRVVGLNNDTKDSQQADNPFHAKLRAVQKQIILDAIELAKGNKAKAAKMLGISRSTLYEKMKA